MLKRTAPIGEPRLCPCDLSYKDIVQILASRDQLEAKDAGTLGPAAGRTDRNRIEAWLFTKTLSRPRGVAV